MWTCAAHPYNALHEPTLWKSDLNGPFTYQEMIVPKDAIIADEKIREYLLKPLPIDDKSGYLALAGYTVNDYWELLRDIREQLLPGDATFQRQDEFGNYHQLTGRLTGPNGRSLGVRTVWQRTNSGIIRFITLYPDRKEP